MRKLNLSPLRQLLLIIFPILLLALIIIGGGTQKQKLDHFHYIGHDHSHRLFLVDSSSLIHKHRVVKLNIKPFAYSPSRNYLVSLGGSISAGAGLKPRYLSHYPSVCDQSKASFAYVMAKRLNLKLIQTACSDARTGDGLIGMQIIRYHHRLYKLPPQLSIAKKEINGSIVTMLVGANDIHWLRNERICLDKACPAIAPRRLHYGLLAITDGIRNTIKKLQADGARYIVIDNYYSVFSRDHKAAECTFNHLSGKNYHKYLINLETLNRAIKTAASGFPNVVLVRLDFTGHGLCSNQPWVQPIKSLLALHPNRIGQRAIAKQNITALENSSGVNTIKY